MLGCIQPMSSPMMNRMLGFCCWAVATPANSGMAARMATMVHIRSLAPTALVFIHSLLSCPAWCRAFDMARPSSLQARGRYPALLHPYEHHCKGLLQNRLEIDPLELVTLWLIAQRIRAAGIAGGAQLDEHLRRRAVAGGFGPGDVNRPGIAIHRLDLPVGIDVSDVEDVATIGPEPAATQRLQAGGSCGGSRHPLIPQNSRGRQGRARAAQRSTAKQGNCNEDPHRQHDRHGEDRYTSCAWLGGTCAA